VYAANAGIVNIDNTSAKMTSHDKDEFIFSLFFS